MLSAVMLDNGEPTIEQSIYSILNQRERVDEIVIVIGQKSNRAEIERIVRANPNCSIRVLEGCSGTGRCRVKGIKEARGDVIVSCDSDTIYAEDYIYYAMQDIHNGYDFVRAGSIGDIKGVYRNDGGYNAFWTTMLLMPIMTVEFALTFRKTALEQMGLFDERFYFKHGTDIGIYLPFRVRCLTDYRMFCWTKFPIGTQIKKKD